MTRRRPPQRRAPRMAGALHGLAVGPLHHCLRRRRVGAGEHELHVVVAGGVRVVFVRLTFEQPSARQEAVDALVNLPDEVGDVFGVGCGAGCEGKIVSVGAAHEDAVWDEEVQVEVQARAVGLALHEGDGPRMRTARGCLAPVPQPCEEKSYGHSMPRLRRCGERRRWLPFV